MQEIQDYLKQFGNIPLPEGTIHWIDNLLVAKQTAFTSKEPLAGEGLILARKTKGRFIPAFPLLDHIGKYTQQKLILDDKMAYLFTCGRDIFFKNLSGQKFPEQPIILLLNEREEVLGVATLDRKERMYKNVLDRGIFLRQEMKKK